MGAVGMPRHTHQGPGEPGAPDLRKDTAHRFESKAWSLLYPGSACIRADALSIEQQPGPAQAPGKGPAQSTTDSELRGDTPCS